MLFMLRGEEEEEERQEHTAAAAAASLLEKNVAAMAKHTYGEALLFSSKTHKPPAAPVRTAGNSAQRLKHVCFHTNPLWRFKRFQDHWPP